MLWPVAVRRLGVKQGEKPEVPAGNWSNGPAWWSPELEAPPESKRSVHAAKCTAEPRPRLGGGRAGELIGRLVVRLNSRRAVQAAQSKELIKAGMCHSCAQPADMALGAAFKLRLPKYELHGAVTAMVR